MKRALLWVGIIVLVIQVCGCATQQRFSDGDAHYTITWSGNKVRRIECRSEKLPDGFLVVNISRGRHYEKVLINDEKQKVWSREIFTARAVTGSSSGVVFDEGSNRVDSDRFKFKGWKLEKNNVPIYKEIIVIDEESGHFKRLEFFGPFGVRLEPPP